MSKRAKSNAAAAPKSTASSRSASLGASLNTLARAVAQFGRLPPRLSSPPNQSRLQNLLSLLIAVLLIAQLWQASPYSLSWARTKTKAGFMVPMPGGGGAITFEAEADWNGEVHLDALQRSRTPPSISPRVQPKKGLRKAMDLRPLQNDPWLQELRASDESSRS